jgi:hypothetical protein
MLLQVMHDKSVSWLACVYIFDKFCCRGQEALVMQQQTSTGLAKVSASNSHSRLCVDVGKFMNTTVSSE